MRREQLSIDEFRRRFTRYDGVLPNGRAAGVSEDDWTAFLAEISKAGWQATARPGQVSDLLPDGSPLGVEVEGTVRINIYPDWGIEDIWFDFDVREMRTQEDLDRLIAFVRLLGKATGRTVDLSYEGADEDVFASYDPGADRVRWVDQND